VDSLHQPTNLWFFFFFLPPLPLLSLPLLLLLHLPPLHRGAKIIATLGPSTWTPEGMSRLLAADVDVVRFNVKHQTPAENQLLLDMWRAVAEADWQGQQERLGLRGVVEPEVSPVGIMVRAEGCNCDVLWLAVKWFDYAVL
jgi:hypothetical protein